MLPTFRAILRWMRYGSNERVVERIMADRAVLPMRFGNKLRDDGALREMLAARQEEVRATPDRVRGRVELGVRVMQPLDTQSDGNAIADSAPGSAVTTGREYLEAKLRDGRRIERGVAALHEPLARLAVAAQRQPARAPEELLIAHLRRRAWSSTSPSRRRTKYGGHGPVRRIATLRIVEAAEVAGERIAVERGGEQLVEEADPENVERGLAQLVLTIVELPRQLMERQALRRVEAGSLDDETVQRLGRTLMAVESRMEELKDTFA
jgi:hypothetical protein